MRLEISFLTTAFRNSSNPSNKNANGIRNAQTANDIGLVPNRVFPWGVYTISKIIINSKAMPASRNLLIQRDMEKTERILDLQTKTFAICVTIMPVKQTVVACKYNGSVEESLSPHCHPLIDKNQK